MADYIPKIYKEGAELTSPTLLANMIQANIVNNQQENARQINTAEAIALATTATNDASSAAILANTNAGLAETATDNANAATAIFTQETIKIYKSSVATYADIATTYPTPANGWDTVALDTSIEWRYNSTTSSWVNIGIKSQVDIATDISNGIVKGGGNVEIALDGTLSVPNVGDLTLLNTTSNTDLVSGINELKGSIDTINTDIGDKTTLTTVDKTDLVNAINEVNAKTENSSIPNITNANLVAEIQSRTYVVGDKIHSKLYGGSYWEVKDSVTLEGVAMTFTDELHIIVNLTAGGTAIAECQLGSVINYAKKINSEKYTETFVKLKRRKTTTIACYGDSITYGQGGSNVMDGIATNFGDGSTYDSNNQVDNPFPKVMQTTLNEVYGADVVSVINKGYSGDRVATGYMRHRTYSGTSMAVMFYGVNDMLYATGNGATPDNILLDTNNYNVNKYIIAYRKMILREMLRGSAVVLLSPYKYQGLTGYDTTVYSGARILQAYSTAIYSLGNELGIEVISLEDFIGYYSPDLVLAGVHPNDLGYDIIGKRLSSVFIGKGYKSIDKIYGERQITANLIGENMVSIGLTGDSKIGAVNNSYQYMGYSSTQGYDLLIGTIYYSFYLEKDSVAVMPIGSISGTMVYSLDFGLTQPEFKIDVGYAAVMSTKYIPLSSVTLTNTTGTTWYNSVNDIDNHMVISGKGWHTLKITNTGAGTAILHGFRFFEYDINQTTIGSVLTSPQILSDSQDINLLPVNGWFLKQNTTFTNTFTTQHYPIGEICMVFNMKYSAGTMGYQELHTLTTNAFYTRTLTSGTWSGWVAK